MHNGRLPLPLAPPRRAEPVLRAWRAMSRSNRMSDRFGIVSASSGSAQMKMNVKVLVRTAWAVFVACLVISRSAVMAKTGTFVVPATADIFSSGQATADAGRGGTLPIEIDLSAGTNRTLQFSATGAVMAGPNVWPLVGPDGGTTMVFGPRPTNITSADGISGMLDPNFEYLAGVFLDANTPIAGTEPAILNFNSIGNDFTDLSPLLQQSFFIGDGLTGTGAGQVQAFYVPESATRLYLGFLDAYDFSGAPGEYADDTGSLSVQITPPRPNPRPSPCSPPAPSVLSATACGSAG